MADLLQSGDKAPDFDLPGLDGPIRLADLKGRPVVLYFYPKDDTTGCTNEAKAFTEAADEFRKLGAVVIGVSKDTLASHKRFQQKYGLDLGLGSAADNDTVERYGAWVQKSMYGRSYMGIDRSTYVIDGQGVIRRVWRKVKVPGHVQEVLAAVRDLTAAA
jgi:peroxiredoxin Q/BCP